MNAGRARAMQLLMWTGIVLAAQTGCVLSGSRTADPAIAPAAWALPSDAHQADCLATAQASFAAGREAEAAGDATCVDHYFAAACDSWQPAADALAASGNASADDLAGELYHASLQALLDSAQHFGRFDFVRGIRLADGQWVSVSYHGLLWSPEELQVLVPAEDCDSSELSNRYGVPGFGVPYVLVTGTSRRPFIRDAQPLAATAVLVPSGPVEEPGWRLEFYDPLRVRMTEGGLPLAVDLSASIAYSANQEGRAWLEDFLWAQQSPQDLGLYMAEPFQHGKIPLVVVHGIASSPVAWANFANEARAQSWFIERYQIWAFRYDTGAPFLSSAAELREQLAAIRATYDPRRVDPVLSQMVLMGHSMGGLLAKLQVTESGDQLWRSAARQPLDTLSTDELTRMKLARAFFFRPSPDVARVIFVATPHQGSGYARRCIGAASASLVTRNRDAEDRHERLLLANPDAFYDELARRLPTSIDLLRPESQILQTTGTLCYRPGVCLHSIVGDHCWSPLEGRTDGVVPVTSARLAGVDTEIIVDAPHTAIEHHPETTDEVLRILVRHAGNLRANARFAH